MNTTVSKLAPSLRERCRVFIMNPRFDQAIIALIVANAITLGLETSAVIVARFGDVLHVINCAVLGIFVAELLLRFFGDPWRVFDFVIVGIALMPTSGAFSVMRTLRVLRLISLAPSKRGVVSALLAALPVMASINGLMALIMSQETSVRDRRHFCLCTLEDMI